jgi:hypothetical protein
MKEPGANYHSTVDLFGGEIIERVDGLRSVVNQIRADIPTYQARLGAIRDELAVLEKNDLTGQASPWPRSPPAVKP